MQPRPSHCYGRRLRSAKQLGRDHPSYLNNLSNFARLLETQGKWSEAEGVHREVLEGKRRVLKDDHPSTMLSMNNLAAALAQLKKFDEAEALHREALERRRRVLGEDDLDTIVSIHNVGRTLALRGNFAEAEVFHREALDKRVKVLGENHAETILALAGLAFVFESQHRWDAVEPLLARAALPRARRVPKIGSGFADSPIRPIKVWGQEV